MAQDIFISYRRQGAGAHAVMLNRDLVEAGYSVFLDFHTLGSGDYMANISQAIDECEDFILLLSQDALNERLSNEDDVMAFEISRAREKNKPIIGIMLDGFESFPSDLPEKFSFLPRINCLQCKMIYYDAMFQKLISGTFLFSRPKIISAQEDKSSKVNTLEWFKQLPFTDKATYMKLLLDLSHEFEASPGRTRFYRYVEDYFRDFGIKTTPPYSGDMPYDIVTYLAFFEPLYIMLASETLDISLVDEMFRYRFFTAVNNPIVQNSELLPQWNSYTNITALYDYWSEYLRELNIKEGGKSMDDSIYLFNYDLHKRQNAYKFVSNNFLPLKINLTNRHSEKKELTLRLLAKTDKAAVVNLQAEICSQIEDKSIFVSLSDQEINDALSKHLSFGLFEEENLAAFCLLILNPGASSDLSMDLTQYNGTENNAVLDCMFTSPAYRGFETQKFLVTVSIFAATRNKKERIFATVSPKNYFSSNNLLKSGFQVMATQEKYGFIRDYFMLLIDDDTKKIFFSIGII